MIRTARMTLRLLPVVVLLSAFGATPSLVAAVARTGERAPASED